MRRSWLRQHNGLLLSLRTCTVAPHQGLVSNPNPSQTCTVAPHQGASAATKQMCPHTSSMSDVIAPPGRGARGVRLWGAWREGAWRGAVGRRHGGEAGGEGRRGGRGRTVAKAAMALGIGPEACDARERERLRLPKVGEHLVRVRLGLGLGLRLGLG